MSELYDLRNNFAYYYDFYISAKESSFSKAGQQNNISPSSLSRSVAKLEELLDLKLVNTTNKGFELTLDGERIYNILDQLFSKIDIFSAEKLSSNLDVTLTIGTTRNIADFILPKYLNKFTETFPNISLKILTDSASNLDNYLLNHKIDVLIDYLPHIDYNEKFDLEVKLIDQYTTCFACSKSYYEKIKDKIHTYNDLSNYTLVISGASRRRQMLDEELQKRNIELHPKHLMPDSKLMADFIKENDCIGYFIEDELKEYDLIKINMDDPMPINPIGIIYPKKTINHVARDFIEIVTKNKEV